MGLLNTIRSSNAFNMFTATGFRSRAALRVGGAAAAGALAGHNVGDGHAVAGGIIGGLAGAGGHMAMRGFSTKIHLNRLAASHGKQLRPWVNKMPYVF